MSPRCALYAAALGAMSLWPAAVRAQGGVTPAGPINISTVNESERELRLAVFTAPGTRSVSLSSSNYATGSPTFQNVEAVWRGVDGGMRLRYAAASGSGAAPAGTALTYLDGRFNIGGKGFNVELGYLMRKETVTGGDSTTGLARAGFRGDSRVGSSGIIVGWAASYMRQLSVPDSGSTAQGIEAETSALYAPPKYPLYVQLGYRREVMRLSGGGYVEPRYEELSVLFFGVGLQLGLR